MKTFIIMALLCSINCSQHRKKPVLTQLLESQASAALQFCKEQKMNTDFCILIDMSIASGKDRLFVYQFENDSILSKGLCTHGSCDYPTEPVTDIYKVPFSNAKGSHCSSIGKYRIGKRSYSNWGINVHYKLHGLEESNDNAYERVVVLHSWDLVSDHEIHPQKSPLSWGCPAVSNEQMYYLDSLLKTTKKPPLLWIYDASMR